LRFSIEHETRLEFTAPVYEEHCEIRLSPRPGPYHRVISTELVIDPPSTLFHYTDVFGNKVHHFNVLKPHQSLVTLVKSEVETTLSNPFDFKLLSPKQEAAWYRDRLKEDPLLWQCILHRSPAVPEWTTLDFAGLTPPKRDPEKPVFESVIKGVEWAASVLQYEPGTSHTHSILQDVIRKRKGVCQDFAHLLLALIRSWEIPARYIMGYMDAGVEGYDDSLDNQASHAWVEALIPGAGWRGFDATNRLCANDLYIPVAMGRDYLDAAPQRGTFKGHGVKQTQTVRVGLAQQPAKPPRDPVQEQQSAQ
jgi:transglutaminase-like putative cysteine protease